MKKDEMCTRHAERMGELIMQSFGRKTWRVKMPVTHWSCFKTIQWTAFLWRSGIFTILSTAKRRQPHNVFAQSWRVIRKTKFRIVVSARKIVLYIKHMRRSRHIHYPKNIYCTLFRMCMNQTSTNTGQVMISYWLPIGREPGKYLQARFTTRTSPPALCVIPLSSYGLRWKRRRVIMNYACHLPVLVPRLCSLPLHTCLEHSTEANICVVGSVTGLSAIHGYLRRYPI
jgi:hypothetical protein